MSLIISTSYSSYQSFIDSTSTEGARLCKCVLAQYRSDSNLDWVGELRALLVEYKLKLGNELIQRGNALLARISEKI